MLLAVVNHPFHSWQVHAAIAAKAVEFAAAVIRRLLLVASRLVASRQVASRQVASRLVASRQVASRQVASRQVASRLVASYRCRFTCSRACSDAACHRQSVTSHI